MCHDYTHCANYDENICPKECFRGELVRDLINYPNMPVSFSNLKGTKECLLKKNKGE